MNDHKNTLQKTNIPHLDKEESSTQKVPLLVGDMMLVMLVP